MKKRVYQIRKFEIDGQIHKDLVWYGDMNKNTLSKYGMKGDKIYKRLNVKRRIKNPLGNHFILKEKRLKKSILWK